MRRILLWLLIIICCISTSVYVGVHWIERQILTPDNWVALVAPLPKEHVVSNSVGSYISERVFAPAPTEAKIADALPPKAVFLAGPLTDQLSALTTRTSQKLVASDAFQTVWEGANRIAMTRLVTAARARSEAQPVQAKLNEKFDVDISQVSSQLRQRLGKASEAIPALQPATGKTIDIKTDLRAKPRVVHKVIRTTDSLAKSLPLLIVGSFLGAIALSWRRRRTAIIIAGAIIICMLLELIAIKLLRQEALNQVNNPDNISAVGFVYDTLVGWFKQMIAVVIIAMVVALVALWLGGPATWAQTFRSYIHTEKLRDSRLMASWRTARQWVGRHEYYVWLAVFILVIGILALFIAVTAQSALNALLLVLSLFALIHIIATPRPDRSPVDA